MLQWHQYYSGNGRAWSGACGTCQNLGALIFVRLEFSAQQKIRWKHSLQQKGKYKTERLDSLPWWGHCVFRANLPNLHLRARRETQVWSCTLRSCPQTDQILRLHQRGLCTLLGPAHLPALAVGADPFMLSGNSSQRDLPFCWHEREL